MQAFSSPCVFYLYCISLFIPLGGSLEVTPLAVKLLDNRLLMVNMSFLGRISYPLKYTINTPQNKGHTMFQKLWENISKMVLRWTLQNQLTIKRGGWAVWTTNTPMTSCMISRFIYLGWTPRFHICQTRVVTSAALNRTKIFRSLFNNVTSF